MGKRMTGKSCFLPPLLMRGAGCFLLVELKFSNFDITYTELYHRIIALGAHEDGPAMVSINAHSRNRSPSFDLQQ